MDINKKYRQMLLEKSNSLNLYSIGYWANTKQWTQTHIRDCETDIPVCGSQISENKAFQWCSWGYTNYDYVECDHCRSWRKKRLIELANGKKKKKIKKKKRKLVNLENVRSFIERRKRVKKRIRRNAI